MLRCEVESPRATLTIDDPQRRNPLSGEVVRGLAAAVEEAAADPRVRVIVITGAGDRAFSAGGDLAGGVVDVPGALHGAIGSLFGAMRGAGKPILARINGHALAGGFGLAVACDLGVAADHARFGVPEVNVGLWPMMITAVLQRSLPHKTILELMMTGRLIDANEALAIGAISRVVPFDDLDETVDQIVHDLAAKSPITLRLGRDAFYAAQDLDFDSALHLLQAGLTAVAMTDDAAEGVAAFLAKRDPEWSGT